MPILDDCESVSIALGELLWEAGGKSPTWVVGEGDEGNLDDDEGNSEDDDDDDDVLVLDCVVDVRDDDDDELLWMSEVEPSWGVGIGELRGR